MPGSPLLYPTLRLVPSKSQMFVCQRGEEAFTHSLSNLSFFLFFFCIYHHVLIIDFYYMCACVCVISFSAAGWLPGHNTGWPRGTIQLDLCIDSSIWRIVRRIGHWSLSPRSSSAQYLHCTRWARVIDSWWTRVWHNRIQPAAQESRKSRHPFHPRRRRQVKNNNNNNNFNFIRLNFLKRIIIIIVMVTLSWHVKNKTKSSF